MGVLCTGFRRVIVPMIGPYTCWFYCFRMLGLVVGLCVSC